MIFDNRNIKVTLIFTTNKFTSHILRGLKAGLKPAFRS
jgi:hypothetical protein